MIKEKINSWIGRTHEVINEKMEELRLDTDSLTQKSIEKFDTIFREISTCELADA